MAETAHTPTAIEDLAHLLRQCVRYDWCRVCWSSEEDDLPRLILTDYRGQARSHAADPLEADVAILRQACTADGPVRSQAVAASDLAIPAEVVGGGLVFSSVLVIRLERAGKMIGTIDMARVTAPEFSDEEVSALQAISEPVALITEMICRLDQAMRVARLEERSNLALDVHGGVVQSLIRIVLQLELAERCLASDLGAAINEIRGARDLARMCVENTRTALLELTTEPMSESPLAEAIVRELTALETAGMHVEISCEDQLVGISPEGEHLIRRVVQEAAMNIRRHSRASSVTATVRRQDDTVELQISDDGLGFDSTAGALISNNQSALAVLAARFRDAGGDLIVASETGRGTTLTALIPLNGSLRLVPRRETSGESRIRVLLVDDQPLFRQGLRRIIERCSDLKIVGESSNSEEALIQIEALSPDVALVDVRLRGVSGIDVVAEMTRRGYGTRALMLSAHTGRDFVMQAIKAGASGYVLKDIDGEALADAIRAVHRGEMLLHPAARKDFAATLQNLDGSGNMDLLSEREQEVLQLIAAGHRNKEIARQLCLAEATIKYHVTNLLGKLDVGSRTEAVINAQRLGLLSMTYGSP